MARIWDYKSGKDDRLAKQVEKDPDICFTKPDMAKYLLSLVDFHHGDVVMNCSYGKGAFYENLPENVSGEFCEINMGKDYLLYDGEVDITLDNPPFVPRKLFWSFMEKAMVTTRRQIYWLINMQSLNVFTQRRLSIMKEYGWFIQQMTIVSDKRWFGRYVWIKLGKEDLNFIHNGLSF